MLSLLIRCTLPYRMSADPLFVANLSSSGLTCLGIWGDVRTLLSVSRSCAHDYRSLSHVQYQPLASKRFRPSLSLKQ